MAKTVKEFQLLIDGTAITEYDDGSFASVHLGDVVGSSGALPSGIYNCPIGVTTYTGVIYSSILKLTPSSGGSSYIEATTDGVTWSIWSEGVISSATYSNLIGPVIGLRITCLNNSSTLEVIS